MTREDRIRAEVKRRGLHMEPIGKGWRIFGFGVDILVSGLAEVNLLDLKPIHRPAPAFTPEHIATS